MRIIGTVAPLMAVLSVLAGCGKSTAPTTSSPDVSNAGDAVAVTADASLSTSTSAANDAGASNVAANGANVGEAPVDSPTTMAGRLGEEAQDRTHVKPEVEDVLAAFEAAGLKLSELKQGIARTSKARFCMFGQSPLGHRVLVCEFADDAEADKGAKFMASQLVDPRRRVEPHGRLALTVFVTANSPEADRESAAFFEVFSKVQAPAQGPSAPAPGAEAPDAQAPTSPDR